MGYYGDGADNVGASSYKTTEKPASSVGLGDFALLQGRPCMVIRRSGPSGTGEYRYLGCDCLTKELLEETTKASTGAEAQQVVQALDLETWGIVDVADGYATAMDGRGDVKSGLTILDQSDLSKQLQTSLDSGKATSGLVLYDPQTSRYLIVDMKKD